MNNPLENLTRKEWALWICSLLAVLVSNILSENIDFLTLVAACIGVTSLVFAAKGNVWSQVLMAVWSAITWTKNPAENGREVAVQKLAPRYIAGLAFFGAITTVVFFLILNALDTPNIVFSTVSVTTSFLVAALTMLRSSYYAVGYAANDIVLIVLWILASLKNPAYISVAVNFMIFFFNDLYGFVSWKKREARL